MLGITWQTSSERQEKEKKGKKSSFKEIEGKLKKKRNAKTGKTLQSIYIYIFKAITFKETKLRRST